jgi:hypothetical protein
LKSYNHCHPFCQGTSSGFNGTGDLHRYTELGEGGRSGGVLVLVLVNSAGEEEEEGEEEEGVTCLKNL